MKNCKIGDTVAIQESGGYDYGGGFVQRNCHVFLARVRAFGKTGAVVQVEMEKPRQEGTRLSTVDLTLAWIDARNILDVVENG